MEKANFGQIVSFLFGIANDCLVDTYDVGDYRKIILPMMVIRRFDAVLEPTKEKVLKMKEQLDAAGITDQDEALCSVAGEAFCNSSPYTLSDLKSRTNQQQLKSDFILYLNGFSQNVQDIIKRFEFRNQIDKLSEHDILGLLISKFTDSSVNLSNRPIYDAKGNLVQPALDNHTMGTVFEEVIRKFNEETNITDAGRHFTPRDIVELITDLAFVPVKGKIQSTTYRIYDGACGTGGMLTVAEGRMQEMAKEFGKNVSIHLYGQENSDETYAIARSDMLVKGEGVQANNIFFGSTISNDGFSGETFDFMLSNPPFGTPWKTDLKAWGDIKKDEITDTRFRVNYKGEDFSLIPDIGDPQMLFLANNISKMKKNTVLGSRIVEVHNSSSLSTGKAGSGPSNLRQYIIEQDMLEAIVALPEEMFYNTPITTYIGVLTNKNMKDSGNKWLGKIPAHWDLVYLWQICAEQKNKNSQNQENNVLSLSHGNIIRKKDLNYGLVPKDYVGYQIVEPGNIILRLTDLQNDQKSLRTALVREKGIITSAYVCLKTTQNPRFIQLILHVYDINKYFYGLGGGVRQSIGYQELKNMVIPIPPEEEQKKIVDFVDTKCASVGFEIDRMIEQLKQEIALLGQYKTQMAADIITGRTNLSEIDYALISDVPTDHTEEVAEDAE